MEAPPGNVISGPRARKNYDFSANDLRKGLIADCGTMTSHEYRRATTQDPTFSKEEPSRGVFRDVTLNRGVTPSHGITLSRGVTLSGPYMSGLAEARAYQAEVLRQTEETERKRKEAAEAELRAYLQEKKERTERLQKLHAGREEKYQQYLANVPSVLTNKHHEYLKGLPTKAVNDESEALTWDRKFAGMCRQFHLSDSRVVFDRCNHTYLLPRGSPHIEAWRKGAAERVVQRYERNVSWTVTQHGENWKNSQFIREEIKRECNKPINQPRGCRLCAKYIPLKKADWSFEFGSYDNKAFENLKWIVDRGQDRFYDGSNTDSDSDSDSEVDPYAEPEHVATTHRPMDLRLIQEFRTEQGLECIRAMYAFLYKEPNVLSSSEFFELTTSETPAEKFATIRFRRGGEKHPLHLPANLVYLTKGAKMAAP